MSNSERLRDLGVVRVRAHLNAGQWTVRVAGTRGVSALGNPDTSFDAALASAVRCLRMAELSAGVRGVRSIEQIREDASRG